MQAELKDGVSLGVMIEARFLAPFVPDLNIGAHLCQSTCTHQKSGLATLKHCVCARTNALCLVPGLCMHLHDPEQKQGDYDAWGLQQRSVSAPNWRGFQTSQGGVGQGEGVAGWIFLRKQRASWAAVYGSVW